MRRLFAHSVTQLLVILSVSVSFAVVIHLPFTIQLDRLRDFLIRGRYIDSGIGQVSQASVDIEIDNIIECRSGYSEELLDKS
jgi:hypothetical protein